MVIDNPILLALNICTLVVIIFSANLLILRAFERQTYLPLAMCLLAIGIIICQPTVAVFQQSLQPVFLILSLPAILLIAPSFWFYVQGLTSETPWHFSKKSFRHFIPCGIGAFIALLTFAMPTEISHALLVEGNEDILATTHVVLRYIIYGMLITVFALVLGWVVQSGIYFYKIIQRLNSYRTHLKDLFASTETKEIRWLTWLLVAVGGVWLATAVNLVLDNLFFTSELDALLSNAVILVMIWSLALWGLRQKPGFEELYNNQDDFLDDIAYDAISKQISETSNNAATTEESETKASTSQTNTNAPQTKYQRSALDQQHADKIAAKIENAMQNDELYLDSSLSLQKLAKHIHTSPNYISQTLNETLGMNFFDYVNKYRVEAAKQHLIQTSDTVLDIAMNVGFNAKSSFYTAFKKETQQTPSQFRKKSSVTSQ